MATAMNYTPIIDFEGDLDAQQLAVVTHPLDGGHAFVVAGAGSGKTRCIAYRSAWILEQGVHPEDICAVSFTKKAGEELGERIARVHPQGAAVRTSTYHSLGYHWLREWELCSGRAVWPEWVAVRALRDILRDQRRWPKKVGAEDLLKLFTELKERALLPQYVARELDTWGRKNRCDDLPGVWRLFEMRKREEEAVELVDMIWRWWVQLVERPDRLGQVQRSQKFFFVDEVQDLDLLQTKIFQLIAQGEEVQAMAIGDPRQSIYGWRGADLDRLATAIEELQCTTYSIDTNYRSLSRIVHAGSIVVEGSPEASWSGEAIAHRTEGGLVEIWQPTDDTDEAKLVVEDIRRRLTDGASANDAAVIYRQNAQSAPIERELSMKGVPYLVHGATSFFDRAEIKDALAYVELVADPKAFDAAKRVRSKPCRFLGDQAWNKVLATRAPTVLEALQMAAQGAKGKERERFAHFASQLEELQNLEDAASVLERVLTLRGLDGEAFSSRYAGAEEEDNSNLDNLRALVSVARGCADLAALLHLARPSRKRGQAAVHLMTVHKSKGLEFDYVYQIGVIGQVYRDAEEESRRILYVGATRAKEELVISCPERVLGRPGRPSIYLQPLLERCELTEER